MKESLIVYAGTKFAKERIRAVKREAKRQGFKSMAPFLWDHFGKTFTPEGRKELAEIETKENPGDAKSADLMELSSHPYVKRP